MIHLIYDTPCKRMRAEITALYIYAHYNGFNKPKIHFTNSKKSLSTMGDHELQSFIKLHCNQIDGSNYHSGVFGMAS